MKQEWFVHSQECYLRRNARQVLVLAGKCGSNRIVISGQSGNYVIKHCESSSDLIQPMLGQLRIKQVFVRATSKKTFGLRREIKFESTKVAAMTPEPQRATDVRRVIRPHILQVQSFRNVGAIKLELFAKRDKTSSSGLVFGPGLGFGVWGLGFRARVSGP